MKKAWLNKNGKILVNKDGRPYYSEECCCRKGCWQLYRCVCTDSYGNPLWTGEDATPDWTNAQWGTPELVGSQCSTEDRPPTPYPEQWRPESPGVALLWHFVEDASCKSERCQTPQEIEPPTIPCQCEVVCENKVDVDVDLPELYPNINVEIAFPMADGQRYSADQPVGDFGKLSLADAMVDIIGGRADRCTSDSSPYLDSFGKPARTAKWYPGYGDSMEGLKKLSCPDDAGEAYVETIMSPGQAGALIPWAGGSPVKSSDGEHWQSTADSLSDGASYYGQQYASMPVGGSTSHGGGYYLGFTDTSSAGRIFPLFYPINETLDSICLPGDKQYTYQYFTYKEKLYEYNYAFDAELDARVATPVEVQDVSPYIGQEAGIDSPIFYCSYQFTSAQWGTLHVIPHTTGWSTIWSRRIPTGAVDCADKLELVVSQILSPTELPGSPLWLYEFYIVPNVGQGLVDKPWAMWDSDTHETGAEHSSTAAAEVYACPEYKILFVTECWGMCPSDPPNELPFNSGSIDTSDTDCLFCAPVGWRCDIGTFPVEYPEPYFITGTYPTPNPGSTYWLHEADDNVNVQGDSPNVPALRQYEQNNDGHAYKAIRLTIDCFPSWCLVDKCADVLDAGDWEVPIPVFTDAAWSCHTDDCLEPPLGRVATDVETASLEACDGSCYIGPAWNRIEPVGHVGGGWAQDLACAVSIIFSDDNVIMAGDAAYIDMEDVYDQASGCPDYLWDAVAWIKWHVTQSCLVTSGATSQYRIISAYDKASASAFRNNDQMTLHGQLSWQGTLTDPEYGEGQDYNMRVPFLDDAIDYTTTQDGVVENGTCTGAGIVFYQYPQQWCTNDKNMWTPPLTGAQANCLVSHYALTGSQSLCNAEPGALTETLTIPAGAHMELVEKWEYEDAGLRSVDSNYSSMGGLPGYPNSWQGYVYKSYNGTQTVMSSGAWTLGYQLQLTDGLQSILPPGGTISTDVSVTSRYDNSAVTDQYLGLGGGAQERLKDTTSAWTLPVSVDSHFESGWTGQGIPLSRWRGPDCLYSMTIPLDAGPFPGFGDMDKWAKYAADYRLTSTFANTTWQRQDATTSWDQASATSSSWTSHFSRDDMRPEEASHVTDPSASAYPLGDWGYIQWNRYCGADIADRKFFNDLSTTYTFTHDDNGMEIKTVCSQSWLAPFASSTVILSEYFPGPDITSVYGSYISSWQHSGNVRITRSIKVTYPQEQQ